MRAEKHLESCTEECHYNTKGICAFGIRHIGCYLDDDVRLQAALIFRQSKLENSIEMAKSILNKTKHEESDKYASQYRTFI